MNLPVSHVFPVYQMRSERKASRLVWAVALAVWAISAASVWGWMTQYACTAAPLAQSNTPASWPAGSQLSRSSTRPTLLFFIHPHCPCTLASIHELERLLSGSGLSELQKPLVLVIATVPRDATPEWYETDAIEQASRLPESEIIWDTAGVESSRFGVITSGATQLYSDTGNLLFSGGITVSRGHEGANAGCDQLYKLLSQQESVNSKATPVFGCQLCVDE